MIGLLASPTYANTPLPSGEVHTLQGRVLKCFNLEQFKDIVTIRAERDSAQNTASTFLIQVAVLKRATNHLEGVITDLKSVVKTQDAENTRVHDMWKEENRLRHIAENKSRFGSWIPWVAAGVLAVSTATLGAVVVLRR